MRNGKCLQDWSQRTMVAAAAMGALLCGANVRGAEAMFQQATHVYKVAGDA